MEEYPNNIVEDAPAGAKKRSSNTLPLVIALLVCAALAVAILLIRGGCSNSATYKLKMAITELSCECPVDYGDGVMLDSVKYDEDRNEVYMLIVMNELYYDLESLKSDEAIMKNQVRLFFSKTENNKWLSDLVNAKAVLKFSCKGKMFGEETPVFSFSLDEVKEMSQSNLSQAEINKLELENWLLVENNSCPKDMDNGMTATKVAQEGDKVVFYFQGVNKEGIKYFRANPEYIDTVKNSMLSGLAGDRIMQLEFRILTNNGLGVVYRHYDEDPKDSLDIAFSVDELRKAIR